MRRRLRPCPRDLWATRARKCALTPAPAPACLPQAPQRLRDTGAGPAGSSASFPHHGQRTTPATASPLRCVPGLPQAAFSLFCPHGSGFPWLCVLFQWLPSAPVAHALSSTSPPFSSPSSQRLSWCRAWTASQARDTHGATRSPVACCHRLKESNNLRTREPRSRFAPGPWSRGWIYRTTDSSHVHQ